MKGFMDKIIFVATIIDIISNGIFIITSFTILLARLQAKYQKSVRVKILSEMLADLKSKNITDINHFIANFERVRKAKLSVLQKIIEFGL